MPNARTSWTSGKTYKWEYPSEWLEEHIATAVEAGNISELRHPLNECISKMAEDDVQDLFQEEMEAAGYFEPLPEA